MIKSTLLESFYGIWPMVVIFTVILSSFRITFLIFKTEKFVLHRELSLLFFIIYILVLFYIVTFQDNNYGFSNFIPFREMFRYQVGTTLFIRNIIGNILLFFPFGLFISYYLGLFKIFPVILLTFISSISIEVTQIAIGRVFDVDDVLLNLFGGVLGYFVYRFLYSIKSRLPAFLRKDWFINFLVIIVFILILVYFTNLDKYVIELVK